MLAVDPGLLPSQPCPRPNGKRAAHQLKMLACRSQVVSWNQRVDGSGTNEDLCALCSPFKDHSSGWPALLPGRGTGIAEAVEHGRHHSLSELVRGLHRRGGVLCHRNTYADQRPEREPPAQALRQLQRLVAR